MTDSNQRDFDAQKKRMIEDIKKKAEQVHTNKEKIVIKCVLLVENTAKRLMTDTAINTAIVYWSGKNKTIAHSPSMEGSAPAVDSGALRRSVTHDITVNGTSVRGRVGSTITNPPYGAYLENGTSRMAPRPWLLPALDMNTDKIRALLYSVFSMSDTSVNIEGMD